ncbi:uncharacterized protein LOC120334948 [Styela clava]
MRLIFPIWLALLALVIAEPTPDEEKCDIETTHEKIIEGFGGEELRNKLEEILTPILMNNPNAELKISTFIDDEYITQPTEIFPIRSSKTVPSKTLSESTTKHPTTPPEITDRTTDPTGETMNPTSPDNCNLIYENSCLHVIVVNNEINFDMATQQCTANGMKLGNIYDTAHFNSVVNYFRTNFLTGITYNYIDIWTGMTINNVSGRKIILTTGKEIGLPHWLENPSAASTYKNIALRINKNAGSTNSGIFNKPPSGLLSGALCEKPKDLF